MNALAVAPIADEVGVMQATGLTTYCGLVYPWHCDHMGHMNVMWYTGKFDEASWAFLARFGVTAAYMREHGRRMAAVEQTIVYRQELFAGDTVTIQSTLLEVRQKSIRFSHQMYKNGGARCRRLQSGRRAPRCADAQILRAAGGHRRARAPPDRRVRRRTRSQRNRGQRASKRPRSAA